MPESPGPARPAALILLALAAAAALLVAVGDRDVRERGEARIAQSAREMVASGDVLVPTLAGEPRLEKPPLATWLAWLGFRSAGRSTPWALRVPFVLLGALAVVFLHLLARDAFGERAGWLAALVLLTSFSFLEHAREADLDGLLSVFVVLAVLAFRRGWGTGERSVRWRAAFAVALGLAFMTKGPVALLHALPALLALALAAPRRAPAIRKDATWGILLFAAIALPWYGYILGATGAGERFRAEILSRAGVESGGGAEAIGGLHSHPPWYFLPKMPDVLAPWVVFLPLALWAASRREARFVAAWFAIPFLAFSAFPGKQTHYLVPLVPAYAILVALGFERLAEAPPALVRLVRWTAWAAGGAWLAASAALPFVRFVPFRANALAETSLAAVIALAAAGFGVGLLHVRRLRRGDPASAPTLVAMVAVAVLAKHAWFDPFLEHDTDTTAWGRAVSAAVGDGDVYVYRDFVQPTTIFALPRTTRLVEDPDLPRILDGAEGPVYFLASESRGTEIPSPYRERCQIVLRARDLAQVARDERTMVLIEYR